MSLANGKIYLWFLTVITYSWLWPLKNTVLGIKPRALYMLGKHSAARGKWLLASRIVFINIGEQHVVCQDSTCGWGKGLGRRKNEHSWSILEQQANLYMMANSWRYKQESDVHFQKLHKGLDWRVDLWRRKIIRRALSPKWRTRKSPVRNKMVAELDNKGQVVGGVFIMLPAITSRPMDGLWAVSV